MVWSFPKTSAIRLSGNIVGPTLLLAFSALCINLTQGVFITSSNTCFPTWSTNQRAPCLRYRPPRALPWRPTIVRSLQLRKYTSSSRSSDAISPSRLERFGRQLTTFLRVGVPALVAGTGAILVFPALSGTLATFMTGRGVWRPGNSVLALSPDASNFVQQFLAVIGLLYSLLVGQTYGFVYGQQEAIYYALFDEVTEAKSLLEQVALVCQGRAMYVNVLESIKKYVEEDLKQVKSDPAVLLSARPVDDPLESIMYMTSVGVPGDVYQTVRSLRQARAARLGALQRKVPPVHMTMLWILSGIMLLGFPLLGAGTHSVMSNTGYMSSVRTVEGCLFGVTAFAVVLTKRVVGELLRPAGGAYNVDAVLRVMVRGLEKELSERVSGRRKGGGGARPSIPSDLLSDKGTSNQ